MPGEAAIARARFQGLPGAMRPRKRSVDRGPETRLNPEPVEAGCQARSRGIRAVQGTASRPEQRRELAGGIIPALPSLASPSGSLRREPCLSHSRPSEVAEARGLGDGRRTDPGWPQESPLPDLLGRLDRPGGDVGPWGRDEQGRGRSGKRSRAVTGHVGSIRSSPSKTPSVRTTRSVSALECRKLGIGIGAPPGTCGSGGAHTVRGVDAQGPRCGMWRTDRYRHPASGGQWPPERHVDHRTSRPLIIASQAAFRSRAPDSASRTGVVLEALIPTPTAVTDTRPRRSSGGVTRGTRGRK